MTIAIIGAGIAGAACAQELVRLGKQVVVFDKGRAAGGRMSSKRTAAGYLDLGAQYFTARSQPFNQQCQQWLAENVISRWDGETAQYYQGHLVASPDNTVRYIGVPSMQAPVQRLLAGIELQSNCRIDSIRFDGVNWQLYSGDTQQGSFQQLILALPQQQAAQLLAPCSAQHLEAQPEQIAPLAAAELQRILGRTIAVKATVCHRWRFAQQAEDVAVRGFVYQPEAAMGLCGDWLNGGRVENAFLSGRQLAAAVAV